MESCLKASMTVPSICGLTLVTVAGLKFYGILYRFRETEVSNAGQTMFTYPAQQFMFIRLST